LASSLKWYSARIPLRATFRWSVSSKPVDLTHPAGGDLVHDPVVPDFATQNRFGHEDRPLGLARPGSYTLNLKRQTSPSRMT